MKYDNNYIQKFIVKFSLHSILDNSKLKYQDWNFDLSIFSIYWTMFYRNEKRLKVMTFQIIEWFVGKFNYVWLKNSFFEKFQEKFLLCAQMISRIKESDISFSVKILLFFNRFSCIISFCAFCNSQEIYRFKFAKNLLW